MLFHSGELVCIWTVVSLLFVFLYCYDLLQMSQVKWDKCNAHLEKKSVDSGVKSKEKEAIVCHN